MKKNYFYALCFMTAISGKLCASATCSSYLAGHFAELEAKYNARIAVLREAGATDCVALLESELNIEAGKAKLYALDLNAVADICKTLLTPRITDPAAPTGGDAQAPKSLISFLEGRQLKDGVNISYVTPHSLYEGYREAASHESVATVSTPFSAQINEEVAEVTAALCRVLSISTVSDVNIAFNNALEQLCHIGNSTARLRGEAESKLEGLKSQMPSIIEAALSDALPTPELNKQAKTIAVARTEVALLTTVVDAFEKVVMALKAAGKLT